MIWHWFNVEIWGPIWPNVFAPGFWTLTGIGLSHWQLRRHAERKHEETKAHISDATSDHLETLVVSQRLLIAQIEEMHSELEEILRRDRCAHNHV